MDLRLELSGVITYKFKVDGRPSVRKDLSSWADLPRAMNVLVAALRLRGAVND